MAGRYELRGILGAGAIGVVHRAWDTVLRREVALKTVQHATPNAFYWLKREFRAVVGLRHPNVVELYDLVVEPEGVFFTMELVPGVDFTTWTRDGLPAGTPLPRERAGRLRDALVQAVAGLGCLHAAGRLHRDVKPANLLVTPTGRVVLLDFGFVLNRHHPRAAVTDPGVMGTLFYMAPDVLWGAAPDEAADWYGLGVVLYETLAGRLPFGDPFSRGTPDPPRSAAPDLDHLAMTLLRERASERPDGNSIRRQLGLTSDARPGPPSTAALFEAPFVGRRAELAALQRAAAAMRAGRTVVAHVYGPSGIGKTALVRHFLDAFAESATAMILAGRCYAQESAPFKALDQLVDALSSALEVEPAETLRRWAPPGLAALARAFPVIDRVDALRAAATPMESVTEPHVLRRHAFSALIELLARIGAERLLVAWIDDLQWGDLDSVGLLEEIARDAPARLLLILSYRSEERESVPLLREIRPTPGDAAMVLDVPLGPLDDETARTLAGRLAPTPFADAQLDMIAAESRGSPFLACELARWFVRYPDHAPGPPALDQVLQRRVAALPEDARRLLEVIAVAGAPVRGRLVGAAAGLTRDWPAAVGILRQECLLRDRGHADDVLLEAYHDRVRESVDEMLSASRRHDHHAAMVRVLSAEPEPDALALLHHCRGAEDRIGALRWAELAAEQATRGLGFEQAARLYGVALEVAPEERQGALLVARGFALANAGRGGEAGDSFLAAADRPGAHAPDGAAVFELRRRGAEQLLRSGRHRDGLRATRGVLEGAGVAYPTARATAVLRFLWHRTMLTLRGRRDRARGPAQASPRALMRLDACWTAATGLVWVDPVRSATFQGLHTRLALREGEPVRLVRALASEGAFLSLIGGRARARRAVGTLVEARRIALRLGDPASVGLVRLCQGMQAYWGGHLTRALRYCRRAEALLRARCLGAAWEIDNCVITEMIALGHTGALRTLAEELPLRIREAEDRADLLAVSSLKAHPSNALRHLADDHPDLALAEAASALTVWPPGVFLMPHVFEVQTRMLVALYRGDPDDAWAVIDDEWGALRRAGLLRFELLRSDAWAQRGRTAVTAALAPGRASPSRSLQARQLAVASRAVARLRRDGLPWCAPWAATIEAGLALVAGDRRRAGLSLRTAAEGFDRAGLALMAAAARYRRAPLLDDAAAGDDQARADAYFAAEGVRAPDRLSNLLLPAAPLGLMAAGSTGR